MRTLIPSLPPSLLPPPSPPIISRRLALALALSLPLPLPSLSAPLCPSSSPAAASKAFLDISIAGVPAGRITIALFASPAAARFAALASASQSPTFRRTQFIKITPSFVRSAALRSPPGGGREMLAEWAAERDRCSRGRSAAGTVGIAVRDRKRPAARVVARNGRIEVVEEEEEEEEVMNGTEIVIAVRDSEEMDEEAVAVGRVVEGMEVVEKIAGVSKVRDNAGSPYFRLAKLIGDKRAVVAERGFNRPYVKVVVTDSGLLMD